MLFRPVSTSRKIASCTGIRTALLIVVAFAIYLAYGFASSQAAYPPLKPDLDVWIKAWGEFAMLPVLPIAAEHYRTFLAIIILPLMLIAWLLMGGSAGLVSRLCGGKSPLQIWLNQVVFAFFPFWILAVLLDGLFSGTFGAYLVPALEGQYGAFWHGFVLYFPQYMYTLLYITGWVYTAIAARQTEHLALWKAVLVGLIVFLWPMLISALLFR